jgi:DNA modification methylase
MEARVSSESYFKHDGVVLYHGSCLDVLKTLPEKCVQCCVTSPPYFALRSYLKADDPLKPLEIGSEPTAEAFVATMVEVFREVRRVLRDDGTLFMNLGDSYGNDSKWGGQLMNLPHRVAEALRADGWIWRQTIVWAKKSPMPESVNGTRWTRCRVKVGRVEIGGGFSSWDMGEHSHGPSSGEYRGAEKSIPEWKDCPGCKKCQDTGGWILRRGRGRCCTGHEYVFLFAKSDAYFWDGEASKEACGTNTHSKGANSTPKADDGVLGSEKQNRSFSDAIFGSVEQRNPRSVWTLSSEPTKIKHFAAFPSELVRRCLVAGCSAGGCCHACGAPYAPMVTSERVPTRPALTNKIWKHADGDRVGQRSQSMPNLDPERHIAVTELHGYRSTCNCDAIEAHCPGCSFVLKYKADWDNLEHCQGVHDEAPSEDMQNLRKVIPAGQGRSEVLQSEMLQRNSAGTSGQKVPSLQKEIPAAKSRSGVLLPNMLQSVDVTGSIYSEGVDQNSQGVHYGICTEASESERQRMRDAASPGNGAASWSISSQVGSSASSKRKKGRQSTRKSGANEQAQARFDSTANLHGDLPLLRRDVSSARKCPHCSEKLLIRDATPAKQIVLDCFGGIGTVSQTARHLGHASIYIDLNRDYVDVAKTRIFEPPRWWLRQQKPKAKRRSGKTEPLLF